MYHNYVFDDVNEALPELLRVLSQDGAEHGSRNGTVKELTHVGITLMNPTQREILLPERKANIAAQIAETAWVLRGRNDLEFLNHYLPRALDYSDDGTTWRGGYGPRLRAWRAVHTLEDGVSAKTIVTDQIQHVVDTLRADPMSRQAVATIYDPGVDVQPGKDIPCNNWLTFTSRGGRLDLHVGIRSNDIIWGWSGINAFEWSVLQEVVAGMLGIGVGALHFSTTNLHLYAPHWGKAARIINADAVLPHFTRGTPRFNATGIDNTTALDAMLDQWFEVEEEIRTGSFTAQESIDAFPEPMFQSWLRVLQWWWTGDHSVMAPLGTSPLEYATHVAVQPPPRELPLSTRTLQEGDLCPKCGTLMTTSGGRTPLKCIAAVCRYTPGSGEPTVPSGFIRYVTSLHDEKHAAYRDSWKRRGEMLGIMANIARKIDRLGGGETKDETTADTAIDLLVYLAKYRTWLDDQPGNVQSDHTVFTNDLLYRIDRSHTWTARSDEERANSLNAMFARLEFCVNEMPHQRAGVVEDMLECAYELAMHLWDTDPVRTEDGQYRGADVD